MMAINGAGMSAPNANFFAPQAGGQPAGNGTQDATAPQGQGQASDAKELMSAIADLFKAVSPQQGQQQQGTAPAQSSDQGGGQSGGAQGGDEGGNGIMKMITKLLEAIVGMLGGKGGAGGQQGGMQPMGQ